MPTPHEKSDGATLSSPRWNAADSPAPVLTYFATLIGDAHAVTAARTVTAFLHGFVAMETRGAVRLGGVVGADSEIGLVAAIRGVATFC